MKKFWNWTVRNDSESGKERVLEFDGQIASESWFDNDITPQMFKEELFADSGNVTIWINSPGGDCIAASQIYTMLMDYKGDITVKIDGIAASAASVIAMAGTKVLMAPTALMMIHNPATGAFGDHTDMKKAIEMLNEFKESIINAYEIKTSLSHDKLSRMMDETTWMNAKKAIELGFADGILEDEKRAPSDESYTFSSAKVEKAVINRIMEKCRAEIPANPAPAGRNITDLKLKLNTIKNYL